MSAPAELGELAAGRDQRLRRDAVPQVRGATDHVALDERDVGAERGGDARAGVPGGTTAEHDEMRHAHEVRSERRRAVSRRASAPDGDPGARSCPRNLSFMSAKTEVAVRRARRSHRDRGAPGAAHGLTSSARRTAMPIRHRALPVLPGPRGDDAARGQRVPATARRIRPDGGCGWCPTSTPSSTRTRSWCSPPTTTARSARSTTTPRSRCSPCCGTAWRSISTTGMRPQLRSSTTSVKRARRSPTRTRRCSRPTSSRRRSRRRSSAPSTAPRDLVLDDLAAQRALELTRGAERRHERVVPRRVELTVPAARREPACRRATSTTRRTTRSPRRAHDARRASRGSHTRSMIRRTTW